MDQLKYVIIRRNVDSQILYSIRTHLNLRPKCINGTAVVSGGNLGDVPKNKLCFAIKLSKFEFVYDTCCQRRVSLIICCKFWLYSFFYKHTGKLGWSSICSRFFFPNLSQNLCLMVCLSSKLISWSNIAFDMNTAMVSLTFEILWVA